MSWTTRRGRTAWLCWGSVCATPAWRSRSHPWWRKSTRAGLSTAYSASRRERPWPRCSWTTSDSARSCKCVSPFSSVVTLRAMCATRQLAFRAHRRTCPRSTHGACKTSSSSPPVPRPCSARSVPLRTLARLTLRTRSRTLAHTWSRIFGPAAPLPPSPVRSPRRRTSRLATGPPRSRAVSVRRSTVCRPSCPLEFCANNGAACSRGRAPSSRPVTSLRRGARRRT
mmetsp:Transcript_50293/g.152939  ORF Transcript_50293/g.152939 Transcript_50293/m.152939 type:complete len:226 (+) Transcript_50293:1162-1839(+)